MLLGSPPVLPPPGGLLPLLSSSISTTLLSSAVLLLVAARGGTSLNGPSPLSPNLPPSWPRSVQDGRVSDIQVQLDESRFVRGVEVELGDRNLPLVTAYLGIRYGALDKLNNRAERRFRPAMAPFLYEHLPGVQRHTFMPNVCPQNIPNLAEYEKTHQAFYVNYLKRVVPYLNDQDEECLNLNIYVPKKVDPTIKYLPVMLFVHGDSYEFGSGNAYDPSIFASYGQIIVITLNYRVGILGFFASENGDAMGNYALLDIQAALQWIHNNIGKFGGDKYNLTVMGHGHGAALVNLFLVSNLASATGSYAIRRVILLSGSASAPWATSKFFHYFSKHLSEVLNCSQSQLRERLVRMSVEELLQLVRNAPEFRYASRMGPVLSKMFFPYVDPERLFKRPGSPFKRADVLMGVTKSQALHLMAQSGIDEEDFRKSVRTFVRQNFVYHQQKIFDILVNFYTDWTKMASTNQLQLRHAFMESLMNLLGDANYVAPIFQMAKYHAYRHKFPPHVRPPHQGNTFMFVFAHTSSIPDYPRWSSGFHGDDLMFIFGAPIAKKRVVSPFPTHFLKTDKMLSEAMMRYISNFVKSGDPNFPLNHTSYFGGHIVNRLASTLWPKFDVSSVEAFYIDQAPSLPKRLVRHYRSKELALWQRLLPSIHTEDNLPVSYHTLNGFANVSLFEEESQFIDERSKFSTPVLYALEPTSTAAPPTRSPGHLKSEFYEVVNTSPSLTANQAPWSSKNALVWTVAAGCALLVLNALVFFGIYYQTGRLRSRRRQEKRDGMDGMPASGLTATPLNATSGPGAGGVPAPPVRDGGLANDGGHRSSNYRNHVNYRALSQSEQRAAAPGPKMCGTEAGGLLGGSMTKSYPTAGWTLPRSYKEEVNGADGQPITMV